MSSGWSNKRQSNIDMRHGKNSSRRSAGNNARKKKKLAYQKERPYSLTALVMAVLILIYCGYMGYRGYLLNQKKASLEHEIEVLENGILDEENRTKELEQYEVHTHTKKFAEEFARDSLGYVYPGEIVFKLEK